MTFIIKNWPIILASIAAGAGCLLTLQRFARLPKQEQLNQLCQWLFYAVTIAEAQFGGKTGELKLRFVYDQFIQRFPKLACIITFDAFSALTDEALVKMRRLLEENEAASALVKGGISCRE